MGLRWDQNKKKGGGGTNKISGTWLQWMTVHCNDKSEHSHVNKLNTLSNQGHITLVTQQAAIKKHLDVDEFNLMSLITDTRGDFKFPTPSWSIQAIVYQSTGSNNTSSFKMKDKKAILQVNATTPNRKSWLQREVWNPTKGCQDKCD